MAMFDFWDDLSGPRKLGLSLGVVAVLAAMGGGAYWLLSNDYEPVIHSNSPEKVAAAVREIERLKVPYHVLDDGLTVEVPRADLGHVKVSLAGDVAGNGGAGFELFNNTDFSTTEFTQKINYQRALQGELARTISTIDGVSSARVHIVLPDSGFLRRKSVQPTAAVNIAMAPGAQLTAGQVYGIQKLVAASVPEIKLDDITVIDQDGIALTKNKSGEGDLAQRGQLELKREVDAYLEGKLKRMLATLDPEGEFSVSVDATLNASESKVSTDDVLPVDTGAGKAAGLVVRERQSQRRDGVPSADTGASSPTSGSDVREIEYKVGHRVEQIATAPGGIERVSVAVLARVGNLQTDSASLRGLIANAIGAKEDDGDAIAVVMLPAMANHADGASASHATAAPKIPGKSMGHPDANAHHARGKDVVRGLAWLLGICLIALLGWLAMRRSPAESGKADKLSDAEVDQIVNRINVWLEKEPSHASR
ncbi:MAG: flagellar basal-body MS-ring/collar protein FliF [Aquabacterium sp.]